MRSRVTTRVSRKDITNWSCCESSLSSTDHLLYKSSSDGLVESTAQDKPGELSRSDSTLPLDHYSETQKEAPMIDSAVGRDDSDDVMRLQSEP